MFNPFTLFSPELLAAFIKAERTYFVRQEFPRGIRDEENIRVFLFSHYPDIAFAKEHYGAIAHDSSRKLYNWADEQDREKLLIAASQPTGYKIFSSLVVPDWKERAERLLTQQVRRFVSGKLEWHPRRSEKVTFDLFIQFGDLYARLYLRNEELRVKLEEIEKFS